MERASELSFTTTFLALSAPETTIRSIGGTTLQEVSMCGGGGLGRPTSVWVDCHHWKDAERPENQAERPRSVNPTTYVSLSPLSSVRVSCHATSQLVFTASIALLNSIARMGLRYLLDLHISL